MCEWDNTTTEDRLFSRFEQLYNIICSRIFYILYNNMTMICVIKSVTVVTVMSLSLDQVQINK